MIKKINKIGIILVGITGFSAMILSSLLPFGSNEKINLILFANISISMICLLEIRFLKK